MKKVIKYIVFANCGADGWRSIAYFNTPKDADEWLMKYVKVHGYSITDFTIKERVFE